MPQVSIRTQVAKPLPETWEAFMDESLLKQWMQGFESIELVEGRKGEVGSVYEMKMREGKRIMTCLETVTDIQPEKLYAFHMDGAGMRTEVKVHFAASPEGTVIDSEVESQGTNLFYKIVLRLFGSMMRKRMIADMQRFRRLVEAQ